MGFIKPEVRPYLDSFPHEEDLLKPFLHGFYVTWAKERIAYNTILKVFFLLPENDYKEAFGFENEVMLIYSPFPTIEPRTLQAVEQIFKESPAKGRVETLNYFLISNDLNINDWLDSYIYSRQESRIIVAFTKDEIMNNGNNAWFVRNILSKRFFGRDLFNYTLPLVEDTYFFGRQSLLMEYYNSVKQGENKAVFGLRKTGKTSLLFKIKRLLEQENVAKVIYIDCKLPHIRHDRWFELLGEIGDQICQIFNIPFNYKFSEKRSSKFFMDIIKQTNDYGKICIIFDEIEYISFVSPLDFHWKRDFIAFWQTLWSCQSQYKNLSFLIAGVNPTVVEQDIIKDVQNPLFGIVRHRYMTGFSIDETRTLINKLGKRMGIIFDDQSIQRINHWYGGHPLLIRLACSTINTFQSQTKNKPIEIDTDIIIQDQTDIDQELMFYCNHAISELNLFYEDEYSMFKLLSMGQELDFKQRSKNPNYLKHLIDYGLIINDKGRFSVNIPVIAQRVAMDAASEEGRALIYPIIPTRKRSAWLTRRKEEIINDIRMLEKLIQNANKIKIFGTNSFPEADQFKEIRICNNKEDFLFFINVLHKCFVESIETYGKENNKPSYFWNDIKNSYPDLWTILERIKVYRNERDHLELNISNSAKFIKFINEDLESKSFSSISEPYFTLQQRILDRFLLSILYEIDKLT